jgi:hypothetical protein
MATNCDPENMTFVELIELRARLHGQSSKRKSNPRKNNPTNTWTERRRIPMWMAAVMKDGKAKKKDFQRGQCPRSDTLQQARVSALPVGRCFGQPTLE